MAGTLSTPLTTVADGCGPATWLIGATRATGAFNSANLPAARNSARLARTARACVRQTPSLRKSNPGISQRGCRRSCAADVFGTSENNRAVTPRNRTTYGTTMNLREERPKPACPPQSRLARRGPERLCQVSHRALPIRDGRAKLYHRLLIELRGFIAHRDPAAHRAVRQV